VPCHQSVVRLDFLDKGRKYDCAIYQDASNADYEKNPSAYVITHRTVKKGDVLKLKQARGGGFAVSLMAK
jgi:glucan 1,4-alpha-glucosidase